MNKASAIKAIALAVAALGSVSANAAFLDATTLAPEVTLFIAGASAQKPGVQAIIPTATFFDTSTYGIAAIASKLTKDTTNYSNPLNFPQGSQGWYGIGATGSGADGKRLLVILSTANGSAAGINQVISPTTTEAEANVVYVGTGMNCVANGTVGYKCDYKAVEADVALSDVYIGEFPATAIVGDRSVLNEIPALGMEGFGIIASPNMYRALQEQNVAAGELAATCTTGATDTTAACQPSISRTNYFNVAASAGTKHSMATLTPNATLAAGAKLNVYRRVDTSGTQAASTMFFLNNPCGNLTATGYVANGATNTAGYQVVLGSQSDDVINGVKGSTGSNYALGVVSLEKSDSAVAPALWVKINGVSPNFDSATGAADADHRKALMDGRYEFQTEMAAYYSTTPLAGGLLDIFMTKLTDASLSNNLGYAYQSVPAVAGKTTTLSRNGAGNCNVLQ
jgi:hypothetical protein